MKEIKDTCYKGTRILLGNTKRFLLNRLINILIARGFQEISIPIIQFQEIFSGKVGEENSNLMFNFKDRGDRDLCLAPEYTAVVQRLAQGPLKQERDLSVFYLQECFRGEKPQMGRYRQFTQLGVEIINPSKDYTETLTDLAKKLVIAAIPESSIVVQSSVKRGLDYYKDGKGFEITCDALGAQKQVCGGGTYENGIGFAIGIDRLLILNE